MSCTLHIRTIVDELMIVIGIAHKGSRVIYSVVMCWSECGNVLCSVQRVIISI